MDSAERTGGSAGNSEAVPAERERRADAEMHRVETCALARTLEGTKAHGRRGHRHAGNGGWVSRTQTRSNASRSTIGTIRCRSNDEGATAHGDVSTAAAGGTSSKGVNRVAGMARRFRTNASFTSVESGRSGRRDAETLRTPAGSRMQQAWKPTCGVNRRGGAKPRGRTVGSAWSLALTREGADACR